MPDDTRQKDIIEADIDAKHRAGRDEGWRAPSVDETGVAQHSIYDGAGNEIVVVTGTNDDGVNKQGTGATTEEALDDVRDTKKPIGEGFYPPPGH
jgi:hypothetical protein